jgi:hypothetical protein
VTARRPAPFKLAASAMVVLLLAGFGIVVSAEQNQQTVPVTPSDIDATDSIVAPVAVADNDAGASNGPMLPVRTANPAASENLFAGHSWYLPPAPAPVRRVSAPVASKPVAPPLPYTYMGSYEQGETTMYFLTKGDRVYDVKVGDVLDETYKVESVHNGQLIFTYLPLHTSQGLRLGEG